MDVRDKLKELNMTEDEIKRLSKAMKDDKFKELLADYAREISDPENKRRYEEEITLMEQERGNKVDFIHPTPFRALRSSLDGKHSCYINICSSEKVAKPAWKSGTSPEGRRGQTWSLPYSLHPGRRDADTKGNPITIYDVVFHPDTLRMASSNQRFMEMVESTATRGIQEAFAVTLDTKNMRKMKTKYKGVPQPCLIRNPIPGFKTRDPSEDPLPFRYPDEKPPPQAPPTKPAEAPTQEPKPTSLQANLEESTEPTRPHYTIKYRSHIDLQDFRNARDSAPTPRPSEILVTVDLPLLRSVASANLEVKGRSLLLESRKPDYRLELLLSYPVDEDRGRASFNRQRGQLTVTLPVLPSQEAAEFAARVLGGGVESEGEEHRRNPQEDAQGTDSVGGEEEDKLSSDDRGEEEQVRNHQEQEKRMKHKSTEQELVEEEAEGQKNDYIGEQLVEEEAEGPNRKLIHEKKVEEEAEGQRCEQTHQHTAQDEDEKIQSEEAEGHDSNQIHEEIVKEEAGQRRAHTHEHGDEDEGPKKDQIDEQSEEEDAEGQTCDQLHQHVVEDLKSVEEQEVEDQTSDGHTLKGEQRQEPQGLTQEVSMKLNEDEERVGHELDEPLQRTDGGAPVQHTDPPTGEESVMESAGGGGGDLNLDCGLEPTGPVEATNVPGHEKVEADAGALRGGTGERSPTPSAENSEGTRDPKDKEMMDEDDLLKAPEEAPPELLQQLSEEHLQQPPEEAPQQLPQQPPPPPPVVLREVDRDGNVTVISDHCTSAGFVFQNSLLEELD